MQNFLAKLIILLSCLLIPNISFAQISSPSSVDLKNFEDILNLLGPAAPKDENTVHVIYGGDTTILNSIKTWSENSDNEHLVNKTKDKYKTFINIAKSGSDSDRLKLKGFIAFESYLLAHRNNEEEFEKVYGLYLRLAEARKIALPYIGGGSKLVEKEVLNNYGEYLKTGQNSGIFGLVNDNEVNSVQNSSKGNI